MTDGYGPVVHYFGPEWRRLDWEAQVDTPVGELCGFCEEAIAEGQAGTYQSFMTMIPNSDDSSGQPQLFATSRPVHYECQMRQVIGSLAHVQGTCSCKIPGSNELDPPGMTRRQAALAAVLAWQLQQ